MKKAILVLIFGFLGACGTKETITLKGGSLETYLLVDEIGRESEVVCRSDDNGNHLECWK
jgi:hypothetical protein